MHRVPCGHCHQIFDNQDQYAVHMQALAARNVVEKINKCSQCDFSFTYRSALTRHIITNHKAVLSFTCDICKAAFKRADTLKKHKLTHSDVRSFTCSMCNFGAVVKANLNLHMMIHTGDRAYKCNQCDFAAFQKGALTTHLRTHSGEKPFACNKCDFVFSDRSGLKSHVIRHTRRE